MLRWVCESLDVLNPAAPKVPSQPTALSPAINLEDPPRPAIDIKTFVATKKPKSDMQFAAVVAHYYRFEAPENLRRATITPDSLQDAARLSGRERLQNPKNTLANAKTQGYLDNPARGEYAINTVGENLVAMSLPISADAAGRAKKQNKKHGKKPAPKKRS